jgi:hypothetical protein
MRIVAISHVVAVLIIALLLSIHALQGKVKRVWDIKHSVPTPAVPRENPLASDARHRKDVVFLKEVCGRAGLTGKKVMSWTGCQLRSTAAWSTIAHHPGS